MKRKRQQKILEIIANNIVLTQDDIQNFLLAAGFKVTQSTVSRDIKELRLIKATMPRVITVTLAVSIATQASKPLRTIAKFSLVMRRA